MYLCCTSTRRFKKILVQQTPEFLYLQVRDKGLHHKPTCLQRCLPVSLISFPALSTSVSHYHGIQSLVSRLQYIYKNIQLFFSFFLRGCCTILQNWGLYQLTIGSFTSTSRMVHWVEYLQLPLRFQNLWVLWLEVDLPTVSPPKVNSLVSDPEKKRTARRGEIFFPLMHGVTVFE